MSELGSPPPRPVDAPGRGRVRGAGALASAVALAALWAIASPFPSIAFPPAALAELLINAFPGDAATASIEALGEWAKRLLTAGVLAASVALGAEALVTASDDDGPRPFRTGLLLAVLGGLVTLGGPHGGIDPVATAAVLVAAGGLYGWAAAQLLALVRESDGGPDAGRRRALRAGVGGALALVTGGGVLGWLTRRLGGPNTDVALGEPTVRAARPDRAQWAAVPGLSREVTTASDHYVVDINLVRPVVEADEWSLRVHGEVAEPLRVGFAQLQRDFEVVEEYAVLACVSNEVGGHLVGHSLWGGVRLADVLERTGTRPGAVDVVFRAADGYSDSIPLAVARDPAVLLAVAQNRRPLTQDHGFPCRLRVPPIYGMKNVKWIQSIEVVGSDYEGYWQKRGWSDDATVRTQSRIDVAGEDGAARVGKQTWVAGVAWAGARGVARVEVSTDGGSTWREAELRAPIGPLSWRQWALRWTPERAGDVEVVCRATDGTGVVQTARRATPHPAGATGRHSVTVSVA